MKGKALSFFKRLLGATTAATPIASVFEEHEHWLASCDGLGTFAITSLFRVKMRDGFELFRPACTTHLLIRAHDNIRDHIFEAVDEPACREAFDMIRRNITKNCAMSYVKVDYSCCRTLVVGALQRMKAMAKVPSNKEQKLVIKLFSLHSDYPSPPPELPLSPPPSGCKGIGMG